MVIDSETIFTSALLLLMLKEISQRTEEKKVELGQGKEVEKSKYLGEDAELEGRGMGRQQTGEEGAGGSFLDGRRSSFSVLNLKNAGDGVNAESGR